MTKYLFVFLFILQPTFAQQVSQKDMNERVLGYFIYGNDTYLVTPKGYITLGKRDINKQYEEYYRKVYGDSTITNPNIILESNSDSDGTSFILPFLDISKYTESYFPGTDTLKLFDFININESGVLNIRDGVNNKLKTHFNKNNLQ